MINNIMVPSGLPENISDKDLQGLAPLTVIILRSRVLTVLWNFNLISIFGLSQFNQTHKRLLSKLEFHYVNKYVKRTIIFY